MFCLAPWSRGQGSLEPPLLENRCVKLCKILWWDGWGLGDETRAALLKALHTEGWISQEILERALESKAGS